MIVKGLTPQSSVSVEKGLTLRGSGQVDQRTSGEVSEFGNGGVLGRVWPHGGFWKGYGPTAVSMALNVSERMFRSHSKSCL